MIQQSDLSVIETSQSPVIGYSTEPRRTSVLLVDDDDLYRDALHMNLTDEGFEVASFSNGRAALDHLDAGNTTDAILLDWRMPEMNGLEVLHQVRARSIATPVIFLTA